MATNYDSWSGFAAGTNIVGNGYTRRGDDNSGSPTVTSDVAYEDDLYVALTAGSSNPITPDGAASVTGLQQSYVRARPQSMVRNWNLVAYGRVATTGDTMYGCGLLNDGATVRMFKLTAGAYSTLDSWTVPAWTADSLVHLLLEVDDSGSDAVLRFKYWRAAETVPASWTGNFTDTTPLTAGWPGFGQRQQLSGDECRFDVFSWGTAEPASLTGAGGALATPTGFTFTAGSAVRTLDGAWTAVSGAATYDWEVQEDIAGVWTAFTSANTATTSFQLTDANGVGWGTNYRARVRAQPAV